MTIFYPASQCFGFLSVLLCFRSSLPDRNHSPTPFIYLIVTNNSRKPQLPRVRSCSPPPLLRPPFHHLLPPERAPFRQPRLPARRLAQHGRAAAADDDGLGVREDGRDGEAAGALDVHEEGAGGRHEGLMRFGVFHVSWLI